MKNDSGPAHVPAVRLRAEGDVDEEVLLQARQKIDAVLSRPGLPPVTGEVRIAKAAPHHVRHPWSAVVEVRVGGRQVVAHAREATGGEVLARLQDRLRRLTEQAAAPWAMHRRATAPPWRGPGAGAPGTAS